MGNEEMSDMEGSCSDSRSSGDQMSEHEEDIMDDEEAVQDKDFNSRKFHENSAWADAMSKILKTNKPKRRKTIVLSRAKRANQTKVSKEENVDFDIENDMKPDVTGIRLDVVKEENETRKLKKKEWASKGYVKPSVLEKDREKALAKIATRGVVQLFNAVKEHQKTLEKDLEDAGPLEHKKDKVMKSLDKRAFLDVLMGPAKSQPVSKLVPQEIKEDADNPTWTILRDDFMMSSKLKDWDKHDTSEVKDEH
ncbi:RRP15-like protein [Macrosteles quadrilineatus]|uniref:RRP15-like protein n=1 Tax=Macrosteles quadrilineatus TaxID=74068 RepID=UPI0023E21636|nr:RRP15-like protein [Macrosteles quadrilineatus]XP_054258225.1 RRP15-like protein [Macrosteles quadrilineatus]XP_054258226.1 RRP15-like protein [Macrosteles quadrilineatus]